MFLRKVASFAIFGILWSCNVSHSLADQESNAASLNTKTGQISGTHTKNGVAEKVCIHKFVYPNYQISTPQGLECGLNRREAPRDEIDYDTNAFAPWLKEIGPNSMIKVNMRYATDKIFPIDKEETRFKVEKPLYGKPRCFLQPRAIDALSNAANFLAKKDPTLRLMVYDCYRPMYVSGIMWQEEPDPIWVGNSGKSGHNIGGTVDITLASLIDGELKELDMGSPFDYFEDISKFSPNLLNTNSAGYRNRTLLRNVMIGSGLLPYDGEWWHFGLPKEKLDNREHLDLPI